jgi:hypothetical protein
MNTKRTVVRHLIALLMLGALALSAPAVGDEKFDRFVGDPQEAFASEQALVEAFTARLKADDRAALARLLGLNLEAVSATEDFGPRLEAIRKAATERVVVEKNGPDLGTLLLGDLAWPFPFPIIRADGEWVFDTVAGLEEAVFRRIGENELATIGNCYAYLLAQADYASQDRDDDDVLEFAQKLKSSQGAQDGLYWPAEAGGEESPLGPFIDEAKAGDPATARTGYFGYRYRILTAQGENVAGGAYDYVINGNMIAGFALIAWPADYGVSGVKTFLVSHHGTVYEKDLGEETEALAGAIVRFDPDATWSLVAETGATQ